MRIARRESTLKLYLSGPVTGCSPTQARDWRHQVAELLAPRFEIIDPTRDSPDYVVRRLQPSGSEQRKLRQMHGDRTIARVRSDLEKCDVLLANLTATRSVSIGSVGEIFWAHCLEKQIFLVLEEGSLHDHSMLRAIATRVVPSLSDAIAALRQFA